MSPSLQSKSEQRDVHRGIDAVQALRTLETLQNNIEYFEKAL